MVVVLRILLFMDPFVDWYDVTYVVILVSMPSYLYLLVGLSQVVLTLESIIKYKNFKLREESTFSDNELKRHIEQNRRFLKIIYIVLYAFMASLVIFFVSAAVIYA